MTLNDLTDIYGLFAEGFLIGALFSGLAFSIGWFVNFFLALVRAA